MSVSSHAYVCTYVVYIRPSNPCLLSIDLSYFCHAMVLHMYICVYLKLCVLLTSYPDVFANTPTYVFMDIRVVKVFAHTNKLEKIETSRIWIIFFFSNFFSKNCFCTLENLNCLINISSLLFKLVQKKWNTQACARIIQVKCRTLKLSPKIKVSTYRNIRLYVCFLGSPNYPGEYTENLPFCFYVS